jgi:hypothetical protein
MLTFFASVVIMVSVVGSLVTWAKHEQRRRSALNEGLEAEFEGSRRS